MEIVSRASVEETLEWIEDWRGGEFVPSYHGRAWPIEMYGLASAYEPLADAYFQLLTTLERIRRTDNGRAGFLAASTLGSPSPDATLTADLEPVFGLPRSSQWPHVRKEHLKKEPACRACGTTDCLQVHHIKPFHLHPELELESTNLVTLCEKPGHDCHFRIGHFLNWTNFNPFAVADADRFREALAVARETAKEARSVTDARHNLSDLPDPGNRSSFA